MPIFYSTWHMVASSIGCAIILRLRGLPPPSLEELKSCWKAVLPLALCTSVNIACNNASLALVSLFVNQVIKGTTPLITVPASMVLEKKRYPWYVIASVVVLVSGLPASSLAVHPRNCGFLFNIIFRKEFSAAHPLAAWRLDATWLSSQFLIFPFDFFESC